MLLFDEISYLSAAKYTLFAAMRAYAIRPYTCSLKFKRISTKYFIENLPFNLTISAIYTSFAHVRAYAIRPYSFSVEIK